MAGVSHATRRPQRGRKVSAAGAAKLALIKTKAHRAEQHAHRAMDVQEVQRDFDLTNYLNAIRIQCHAIIDLCEEESNEHD